MPEDDFNHDEVSRLINSAFSDPRDKEQPGGTILRSIFEKKLQELDLSTNQIRENLEIEQRTLNGVLDGTQKRVDVLAIYKIAQILGMSYNEVMDLFLKSITQNHKDDVDKARRRAFILNNFDLPTLRNAGVIESIRDLDHIEHRLNSIFGLNSILDYDIEEIEAAFSSTNIKPKNLQTRKYFIKKAQAVFKAIANPNPYEKQALIDYFPKIRWHSTDVNLGLANVMKSLYKLGVTVIFQHKMPQLQVRGATFSVNKKPCIVITNYREYYPTMWFAFLHELFHVLFDWQEILARKYHLSDEEGDLFVVKQKEEEANEFAREFLFPKQKMERIINKLHQKVFIREFALDNHVHQSIIYANHAWTNSTSENNLWAQYEKYMPEIDMLIENISGGLTTKSTASEFATHYKTRIFNNE